MQIFLSLCIGKELNWGTKLIFLSPNPILLQLCRLLLRCCAFTASTVVCAFFFWVSIEIPLSPKTSGGVSASFVSRTWIMEAVASSWNWKSVLLAFGGFWVPFWYPGPWSTVWAYQKISSAAPAFPLMFACQEITPVWIFHSLINQITSVIRVTI